MASVIPRTEIILVPILFRHQSTTHHVLYERLCAYMQSGLANVNDEHAISASTFLILHYSDNRQDTAICIVLQLNYNGFSKTLHLLDPSLFQN